MHDTQPAALASLEHPLDILRFALAAAPDCALVALTNTEGGGVRAPGALMAVTGSGVVAGYISGGCIDGDLRARAQAALATGRGETLRYGAGSEFIDLALPCGGAIEAVVAPAPPESVLRAACDGLAARRETVFEFAGQRFTYRPKLRLRLAGRGADLLALARLALAAGFEVVLQTPDSECLALVAGWPLAQTVRLEHPADLPANTDDAWTAFALLFHDSSWEVPLLADALAGPAFYVGAVGSRRTQARRHQALLDAGANPAHLSRLRGPIGLVPAMREATGLAVSCLAEIVAVFNERR